MFITGIPFQSLVMVQNKATSDNCINFNTRSHEYIPLEQLFYVAKYYMCYCNSFDESCIPLMYFCVMYCIALKNNVIKHNLSVLITEADSPILLVLLQC